MDEKGDCDCFRDDRHGKRAVGHEQQERGETPPGDGQDMPHETQSLFCEYTPLWFEKVQLKQRRKQLSFTQPGMGNAD